VYERAYALDPKNDRVKQKIEEVRVDVPALLSRALIASASGNYEHALSLFDDILEVDPGNVNALIGKAVAYRRSNRPREALNCLDLVLSIQPENVSALLNKGHILQEEGDYEGAIRVLDRLVSLSPGDEEAWTDRGDILWKVGRDDDALRSYAEALKLNPGDEDVQAKIHAVEAARSIQLDVLQELYKVRGIGPAKAKALIDAGYRTAEDFEKADMDKLMAVKGVTKRIAQDLVKHFREVLVEAR
jgi:tetratricopeptide (TPR) repeat protein